MKSDKLSFLLCRIAACVWICVLALSAAVVEAQQVVDRTLTPVNPGDPDTCPITLPSGPLDVTLQGDLGGLDAAEAVIVVETVLGDGVAGTIVADGAQIEDVEGIDPPGQVGIFQDALPLARGGFAAGCIGQLGEWEASYDDGTDEYTLADSWGDIWQEGDTFTFAYSQVVGDFALTTHIKERNPHPWCRWGRNGVMIRQDLTNSSRLNLIFDNMYGDLATKNDPFNPPQSDYGITWGNRRVHGNTGSITPNTPSTFEKEDWLRIRREGDTMIGDYSADGATWIELARATWSAAPETVLVGLALSGRVGPDNADTGGFNCSDEPSRVTYDGVELVLGAGGQIVPFPESAARSVITWNTTRGELAAGLSYRIDVQGSALTFEGDVGGEPVVGEAAISLVEGGVGPTCGGERSFLPGEDCTVGRPRVVVIRQPLQGGDPDEVVQVTERLTGDLFSKHVTAEDGGVVESGPFGVAPLGTFQAAIPLATQAHGATDPGCIGEPGQWEASYDAGTGEYTLADSWGDIWQEGDTFTFAYSEVKGDFLLTAHIKERNPHPWCRWGRNGVMVRQDLTNASRLNLLFDNMWGQAAIDDGGIGGQNEYGLSWGNRRTHGNVGSITPNEDTHEHADWLQIERFGDTMIGHFSDDGSTWFEFNQTTWSAAPESVLVGLALSGRNGPGGLDRGWINCEDEPSRVTYDEVELVLADGAEIVPLEGGFGVDITWNVTRRELDEGISYSIDIPQGDISFAGEFDGVTTRGPETTTISHCPAERTIADCPAEEAPLSVTIAQPVGDSNPDEVVELREVVTGPVSAKDVTANGATTISESLRGLGIFGEAVPLATQFHGEVEPGCIDQPGEWSATYDAGADEYTLADSWGDIWQEGDTFTFAYSEVKGDFTLTARIAERNPHPSCRWGRNGLMIRQDLTTASRLSMIFDNLWGDAAIDALGQSESGLSWFNRPEHGFLTTADRNEETLIKADWLQITREGDTMTGEWSDDGSNWDLLSESVWDEAPETVIVGLALSGRVGPGGADNGFPNCDEPPSSVTYSDVEFVLADGAEVVHEGVEIIWSLTRSALAAGVSYQLAGPPGESVEFRGFSGNALIAGPGDAEFCGGGTGDFRRGDANSDGAVNLADGVAVFNFLFLGGDEPTCLDAADTNDADDTLNLTDGVYLLNFLFLGGDPPPGPGPFDCGPEPAGSITTFGCERSPCP